MTEDETKKTKKHHQKKDGHHKKKKHSKKDVTEMEEEEQQPEAVVDNGNGDDKEMNGKTKSVPPSINGEISSLNKYYGNRKGFFCTLSMVLNAGLMVYAHVGLSAVVLSSQPPVESGNGASQPPLVGQCNEDDLMIWQNGGQENRTIHSNFCSRRYNGVGCLVNASCIEECFAQTYGYSQNCSTCFAAVPQCSVDQNCALPCAADSFSQECQDCNVPCTLQLNECLGFPTSNETTTTTSVIDNTTSGLQAASGKTRRDLQEGKCTELDLDSLNWYVVYELTFINSIEKAWNGDARFLAIIIVLFSGIWPYAKNIILVWAWYWPLSTKNRTSVLTWLLRLSKYTLVDVFAVISVLVGVLLELNVGGTEVATRAEPRPAIIAFFFATLWEFVQIEWVVHCHNHHVHYDGVALDDSKATDDGDIKKDVEQGEGPEAMTEKSSSSSSDEHLLDAMRFRTKLRSDDDTLAVKNTMGIHVWVGFLLVSTLALYMAGAMTELVQFTSFGAGDTVGCKRSYNLVTFANAMVSDLALTANSAKPATWTLYFAYIILVLFLPIVVHFLQIVLLSLATFGDNKQRNERVCRATSSLWGFSSVEVLLIGLYSVESKFHKFVAALAGNDNAQFFSISTSLGPAFSILIVYAFASGFLQYFIYCATAEYYKIDPYHKVHVMWTKLFGCWLEKKTN